MAEMPRTFRAFLAPVLGAVMIVSPLAHAQPGSFPDMERSWFGYANAVDALHARGVIAGHPDGTFQPKSPINRAEFLKIVFRGRSETVPAGSDCFPDVPADAWFAPYVCAAARRGIVNGYPDGTFKPEQTVNIAEAMKMLALAYKREVAEAGSGDWHEPYTKIFAADDILPRSSYHPWNLLTRERAADLLHRTLVFEEDRLSLRQSTGCGTPQGTPPSAVTVDGVQRNFLLTVPETYSARTPAPLIIAFHGRTNSNAEVRSYYGLDRAAEGYFIAYPEALTHDTGSFRWTAPDDKPGFPHDIELFDELVEQLSMQYCIDINRIFVVGHSLGAWMANSVACIRGGIVRASATVGGDSVITDCAGPSAALLMHNPNDNLSPISGAEMVRWMRAEASACLSETDPAEPASYKCVTHRGCGENTVTWCPHEFNEERNGSYYPHQWPRGTAEEIVKFFEGLE